MDTLDPQSLATLINMIQGGGRPVDTGAPPSGLPPIPALSGLWNVAGLSGAPDTGAMSGATGRSGGLVPGITGGPSLAELNLEQQSADTGTLPAGVNLSPLTSPIGGTLGQGGQYGIAGGVTGGAGSQGYTQAGQSAGGSSDPLALLQKILGAAKSGVGLASPLLGTDSAVGLTQGDISGTTPEAQAAFAQQRAEERTASPFVLPAVPLDFTGNQTLSQTAGPSSQLSDLDILRENLPPGEEGGVNLAGVGARIGTGSSQTSGGLSNTLGLPSPVNQTNPLGAIQGGLGAGLGLLNILQGAQGGNVQQGVGGGLQGLGGVIELLKSSPGLAQALGIDPSALSSLGAIGGGLGGLLGIAGGAEGLASGNPGQIGAAIPQLAGGSLATYQALQSLLGNSTGALTGGLGGLGTAGLGAIYGLIGSGDPTGGGNVAGSLSGLATTLSAASQGASSLAPLAGAIAGPLGAAAPIVAGLIAYLGQQEQHNARVAGYANNPIAGGLNSAATAGVGSDLGLLDQLKQGGGIQGATTEQLEQYLPQLVNNLGPYYSTAEGPKTPIRASDALTGLFGRPGLGGADQYTKNEQQAQQGVMDIVNELMGRGVSYQQLGQLPVSPAFSNLTMDMYNPLNDLYAANKAQYDTAAAPLLQSVTQASRQMLDPQEAMRMAAEGQNPATFGYTQDASGNWYTGAQIPSGNPANGAYSLAPGQLTPDLLFQAAQGANVTGAPDSATHAGGLTTAMYGGPLWAALARMQSPTWANPAAGSIQSLIEQNFNPWAVLGGFNPGQLQTSLMPVLQAAAAGGGGGGGIMAGGGPGGVGSAPAGDGVSSGVW